MRNSLLLTAAAAAGLAGDARAAEILVTGPITTSQTWTANNTYNLQGQVYVKNMATLTIQAGTVVASDPGGSLAVSRDAQIIVQGTSTNPVIMTSKADVATWTAGNPATGVWREAANEWGNLTVMGRGFVSEDAVPGNVPTPNANNVAPMEGLIEAFPGDPDVLYGGGDDDDDSGSIRYLSLRYGGRVVQLDNELNGLSLGGIGRGTDIDHVEIMNNVDDGIEVWGGTVNLEHFSIWNVGDDSFDFDQGWRGQAQFGFIVQGYSVDAPQGSGVGDNAIESDGAEDSDWQPVTTASIYNLTVVGQPVDGDHGTAWRDNARVQYGNCIFMDLGEQLVRFDNVDGDGGSGYGFNGTLSWPATWTTNWNAVPAHANDGPASLYQAQASGKLAQITDSVFFRNQNGSAYTEATARGVFNAANNNVLTPGFLDADAPVLSVTRGPAVVKGTKTMLRVIAIDPRPANDAVTSVGTAPNNGFFTPVQYRGAFSPTENWLTGWTAAHAFGFLPEVPPMIYCTPKTSSAGCTSLIATSAPADAPVSLANDYQVTCSNVQGLKNGLLFAGINGPATIPFAGGVLCVRPPTKRGPFMNSGGTSALNCTGSFSTTVNNAIIPTGLDAGAGNTGWYQYWYRDPMNGAGSLGTALSNGVALSFL